MNNQFIQRVIYDWNRIDNDSYLKRIEAFKGIEKLDFNKSITLRTNAKTEMVRLYIEGDMTAKDAK